MRCRRAKFSVQEFFFLLLLKRIEDKLLSKSLNQNWFFRVCRKWIYCSQSIEWKGKVNRRTVCADNGTWIAIRVLIFHFHRLQIGCHRPYRLRLCRLQTHVFVCLISCSWHERNCETLLNNGRWRWFWRSKLHGDIEIGRETREIYDLWLVPSISDIRHSYVCEMMKKKSAQHDGHTLLLYHYVSYLTFTRSI